MLHILTVIALFTSCAWCININSTKISISTTSPITTIITASSIIEFSEINGVYYYGPLGYGPCYEPRATITTSSISGGTAHISINMSEFDQPEATGNYDGKHSPQSGGSVLFGDASYALYYDPDQGKIYWGSANSTNFWVKENITDTYTCHKTTSARDRENITDTYYKTTVVVNQTIYYTSARDRHDSDEERLVQRLSIEISIVTVICFCICVAVVFYFFKKHLNSKKELAKTKQQTKNEIGERERKHSEAQQKSEEQILELQERLKKSEEEHEKKMNVMVQPGYFLKNSKSNSKSKSETSTTIRSDSIEGGHYGEAHTQRSEGYEKVTQAVSAVRLDIPPAAYTGNKNVHQTNDGGNTGGDEKGVMDEMLVDVLEMQNLDPNKIKDMDVDNMVDEADDDTDSNSDNMYDKPDDDDEKKEIDKAGNESLSIHTHSSHRDEDMLNELNVKDKEKRVGNEGLPK